MPRIYFPREVALESGLGLLLSSCCTKATSTDRALMDQSLSENTTADRVEGSKLVVWLPTVVFFSLDMVRRLIDLATGPPTTTSIRKRNIALAIVDRDEPTVI